MILDFSSNLAHSVPRNVHIKPKFNTKWWGGPHAYPAPNRRPGLVFTQQQQDRRKVRKSEGSINPLSFEENVLLLILSNGGRGNRPSPPLCVKMDFTRTFEAKTLWIMYLHMHCNARYVAIF